VPPQGDVPLGRFSAPQDIGVVPLALASNEADVAREVGSSGRRPAGAIETVSSAMAR
jgi:hypothetical protein